jgi:hypothetical protein
MIPRLQRTASVLSFTLLLAAGGCAFDSKWDNLAKSKPNAVEPAPADVDVAAQDDPLTGRWEGKWVSDACGHTGALRAIITRKSEAIYHAEFDATYFPLLRFGYDMELMADRQKNPAEPVSFKGQEDLGLLAGGVYFYKGSADGDRFTSTYESSDDHGRFEMTRPTH